MKSAFVILGMLTVSSLVLAGEGSDNPSEFRVTAKGLWNLPLLCSPIQSNAKERALQKCILSTHNDGECEIVSADSMSASNLCFAYAVAKNSGPKTQAQVFLGQATGISELFTGCLSINDEAVRNAKQSCSENCKGSCEEVQQQSWKPWFDDDIDDSGLPTVKAYSCFSVAKVRCIQ